MAWSNGSYQAVTTGFNTSYSMVLRVDLNPVVGTESYISLDLYRGFMLPNTNVDILPLSQTLLYLGSFRSDALPPQPSGVSSIPSTTLWSLPDRMTSINLELLPAADQNQPTFLLSYNAPNANPPLPVGPLQFLAQPPQWNYHSILLTIDTSPDCPKPYGVAADPATGRPSFWDCFRRAGFDLIGPVGSDGELPPKSAWTLRDLVDQETMKPQSNARSWSLNVYLMIASTMAGSDDTTGAMFDRSRRGAAAVFYQTLKNFFGRSDSNFELDSNFLFTAVHEVAHCLNLPHSFEESALPGLSSASATFMNYPQDYTGGVATPDPQRFQGAKVWNHDQVSCYRQFWADFRYNFHSQELLELRHGARRNLVVGDSVSPYRGAFTNAKTSMAVGGSSGLGLELTLRLRGPNRAGVTQPSKRIKMSAGTEESRGIFEFVEPIQIEAELHNHLNRSRPISRRLSAVTGDLQIHYQTPDNQFLTYQPPCALCYIPGTKVVLHGKNLLDEPASCHKDICLNIGGSSFKFLTPGRYRVRASYKYHDTLLVSNILELFVRYPSPTIEDLIVPLLDEEIATYLAFRGVGSLSRARERLQDAFHKEDGSFRRGRDHPLRNYFNAYEAMIQTHESPHQEEFSDEDLRVFAQAIGVTNVISLKDVQPEANFNLAALPFSNIALGKIGQRIYDFLKRSPQLIGFTTALRDNIDKALKLRGVPERHHPNWS